MRLEDESLLSAYLDDELDEGQRRQVEYALRDDPALGRLLVRLREARDFVAELPPCPAPDHLALNVVVEIDRRRRYGLLMITTAALATAAALFLAVLQPRLFVSQPPGSSPPILVGGQSRPPTDPTSDAVSPSERSTDVVPASIPGTLSPGVERARKHLANLDKSNARRLLVPVSALDADTIAAFERDVRDLARLHPEYVKMVLGDHHQVDAVHPGASVVFALQVNPEELVTLLTRFSNAPALRGTIHGDQPDERTLTALEGIDRLELGEGKRGATVRVDRIGPELRQLLWFLKVPAPHGVIEPPPDPPRPASEAPKQEMLAGPSTLLIWLEPIRPDDDGATIVR
jgi:hypothetical protein